MRIVIPMLVVCVAFAAAPTAEAQEARWPAANGAPTPALNLHVTHQVDAGWLWAGAGAFVAAYAAKIPGAVAVLSARGVYDAELSYPAMQGDDGAVYKSGCRNATAGMLLVPVVGGILGVIAGHSCHNTGSHYNDYPDASQGFYVYQRSTYYSDNEVMQAMAWVAFGIDLIGIVFTVIGLIGGDALDWDEATAIDIDGHRLRARASSTASGAELSFSLEL